MIEGKSGLAIIRHALMDDLLAAMRVKDIGSQQFRALMDRAALILAVEAMRTLAVRPVQISAPFGSCSGFALRRPPIFISVLRAGNALLQAFTTLVPQGQVGFIGLERNPQTL
ncbi:MAG: uracil phosphoribosyltransferase, partial [Pseudomonadota bacterium]